MKRAVLGLLSLALACAIVIGLGLFSAKEQGPPGLAFSAAPNLTDISTPLLFGAAITAVAGLALLATSPHFRMPGGLLDLLNSYMTFAISLAAAAVLWAMRLVPVPHFTSSRLRSV